MALSLSGIADVPGEVSSDLENKWPNYRLEPKNDGQEKVPIMGHSKDHTTRRSKMEEYGMTLQPKHCPGSKGWKSGLSHQLHVRRIMCNQNKEIIFFLTSSNIKFFHDCNL